MAKIYADFNGMEVCPDSPDEFCLDLTGYGTLASLSAHEIKLSRGLALTLFDPDGLEVKASVDFDKRRVVTRSSGWYAKFKKSDLRSTDPQVHDYSVHQCFKCRKNIKSYLDGVGRQFREACPYCGTSVMYAMLPPSD